jgi:hypothetical protein
MEWKMPKMKLPKLPGTSRTKGKNNLLQSSWNATKSAFGSTADLFRDKSRPEREIETMDDFLAAKRPNF